MARRRDQAVEVSHSEARGRARVLRPRRARLADRRLSAEDEHLWRSLSHRLRHQRLHLSRVLGQRHHEAADAADSDPHAPAPAVPRAALPLFHSALPQDGLGDRLQQDHLLGQGSPDSDEGESAGLRPPRALGQRGLQESPRAIPSHGRNTGAGTRTTPSSPSITTPTTVRRATWSTSSRTT